MVRQHLKRFWPMWAALGFPVALVALNATPLATNFAFVMIGVPGLLALWAALGIWAIILAMQSMRRREWSGAVTRLVLPLVLLAAGTRLWQFVRFCNYCGDVAHFVVKHSAYVEVIRATPQN